MAIERLYGILTCKFSSHDSYFVQRSSRRHSICRVDNTRKITTSTCHFLLTLGRLQCIRLRLGYLDNGLGNCIPDETHEHVLHEERENHLVTYNSGGRRSQIDFIMLRKEYTKECKNCKVLPKGAITTQHRVLIAELEVKATRKRRVEGRKLIRWWKLKNNEVRDEFRRSVVERMANAHEVTIENGEEWWEETAGLIRSCGVEVCGRSSGKKKPGLESWWWKEETEKAVRKKEDRLKMWKRTGEDDDRNEYKRAKGAAKKVVARVKAEAIEELYANLETSEGQKDIYRIAAARDRAGKDIGQMRTIKSATGEVLMRDEDIREIWGQ